MKDKLEVKLKGWISGPGRGSGFSSGFGIGYSFGEGESMDKALSDRGYREGDKVVVSVIPRSTTRSASINLVAEITRIGGQLSLCYDVSVPDCLDRFKPEQKVDIFVRYSRSAA